MPRGGKRPGAGAPKGNMNNLKHGLYSKQYAAIGRTVASDPKIQEVLLELGRRHDLAQQKANEIAAYFFARMMLEAKKHGLNLDAPVDDLDSINEAAAKVARAQIRKASRRAAKILRETDVNQTPDTNPNSQSEEAA